MVFVHAPCDSLCLLCEGCPRWVHKRCSSNSGILREHYSDVIMGAMASQITSLTIVYPTVYSGADQRKHQSSESLALVWGIHRWAVNSPHTWPVTRKMLPFDDVIMMSVAVGMEKFVVITSVCYLGETVTVTVISPRKPGQNWSVGLLAWPNS